MLEFLTVILFFVFLDKLLYERMESYLLIIPAILFINLAFVRNLIFTILLPIVFFLMTKRKSIMLKSLILSLFSSSILALNGNFYPFYPIINKSTRKILDIKLLLSLDVILIYFILTTKRRVFINEKVILLFSLILSPSFLNLEKDILLPSELYSVNFENRLVCVNGIINDVRKVNINGKELYFVKLCLKKCIYFYTDEKLANDFYTICGYVNYKNGKVYLKMAYIR